MTVYAVRNKINGKLYVGKTVGDFRQRWHRHCYSARRGEGWHLQCAIRKYGPRNFELIVLADGVSGRDELNRLEKEFIQKLQSTDPTMGYNMTDGGDDGSHTEESRARLSAALMGNKNSVGRAMPSWQRQFFSQRMKGFNRTLLAKTQFKVGHVPQNKGKKGPTSWNKGKRWPEEVRAKMREAAQKSREAKSDGMKRLWQQRKALGIPCPFLRPDIREAARKACIGATWNRGRKRSPEVCAQMSRSHTGKTLSLEHRLAISVANKGKPKPKGSEAARRRWTVWRAAKEQSMVIAQ